MALIYDSDAAAAKAHRHEVIVRGALVGTALALGAVSLWCSVRADISERRCTQAVSDICLEAGKDECDKDAECERYLARYCRARAVNECEGE